MTTYRLWPATNGGSATAFGGSFISGTAFGIAGGGKWLQGYWWWCAASVQSTAPVRAALWSATSGNAGVLVPGSTATSGTLTAGQWNFIPLASPIQLAPSLDPGNSVNGSAYIAAVGFTGAFPDTNGYWGTGGPGAGGISNGPLTAYSGIASAGGTRPAPYTLPQGLFSTAGSDPAVNMPNQASSVDNFWVDVQVSDTAPPGYAGTYRLWPSKSDASNATVTDTTTNDAISTEVRLSQSCQLARAWYYSPASAVALGTRAQVWRITGANAGTLVADVASPSWSGAAASGWVSCAIPGSVILPAGHYKVAVSGPASNWGPKDAGTGYWSSGVGSAGIVNGPLSAPQLSAASLAYNFNGNAGGTPPYSDGTTLAGQPTFAMSQAAYPYLYAPVATPSAGSTQNYWVDLEVTPLASGGLLMASGVM